MTKPFIGIVGSTAVFGSEKFSVSEKYCINTSYLNAVKRNGGIPMPIPLLEDNEELHSILKMCDAILLPGGEDIDPEYYNEDPHKKLGTVRPELDSLALRCLDYAKACKLPVLGICKGIQLINVSHGGSLYQDINSQCKGECILHEQDYSRAYTLHKVKIEENSVLFELFGELNIKVNTMHHQAIKEVGKGLKAIAFAPDGIIEGVESEDGLILGVQWHPEELVESVPVMNRLFERLINLAKK
ncbi:MAG: gamma-glutamyl-gamma-aminobutyrate hydrolase family protein [Clostridiales bacterium]|jgi:putative glutamine amidotransferase|nr:gamma-glutamyl-gamma-aminobutyrate hydrolase family protein [Clostridiales bacterium]